MRSGAMVTILRSIGWGAGQLEGGYKTFRRQVVADVESLPGRFAFTVICGATGSAKTRVLQAMARRGAQVLDLETLASHKGSVLGVLPDHPQPSQKWFETLLASQLAGFSAERPVYVEAESRKIGRINLPAGLIERMRQGECLSIEASFPARVAFLLQDYDYYLRQPAMLKERLSALHGLVSNELLQGWNDMADKQEWSTLVTQLLENHYDPLYRRSQGTHYQGTGTPRRYTADDLSPEGIEALAGAILAD